ncbi:MAG: VWA domain-containing protein [Treponema sp.]|jgi:hypothetical protein|nr:VWA domain-containing protein [Treponema sp.]
MVSRIFRASLILALGLILLLLLSSQAPNTQDLSIGAGDLLIEPGEDGGYHLYIRKKPGINSVLLTESTKDPQGKLDNYAYRAPEWNSINGDELRVLNGAPIPGEDRIYSLIDSTPETHPALGAAFHIFLPYILSYGSADTRHGEVYVAEGTWINIRAFSMPYADYRGRFQENPFVFTMVQRTPEEIPPVEFPPLEDPPETPAGNYLSDAVSAFRDIAGRDFVQATGPEDMVEKIGDLLRRGQGQRVDLVLCLDTTSSMKNSINVIKRQLMPMLKEMSAQFTDLRLGLVLYKDYYDDYLNRVIPFTRDLDVFQASLNRASASGGRDVPEAVYEALYEGAVRFPWEAEVRLMILIGDAPPHLRPQGNITKEMLDLETGLRNIRVGAILLPRS